MKKEEIIQTLKAVLKTSPKRKFKQSVELIINLKEIDLKKPEERVDLFIALPHPTGRDVKVCALVGPEMGEQASKFCDKVILEDGFAAYEGKKKDVKKLAQQYDYFIAQVPLMAKIAKIFGRYFGPRGRMPNPKAGCVVPTNTNFEVLCAKLKNTVRVQTKNAPNLQIRIGRDDLPEEHLFDNINTIYSQVILALPKEEHNVKNVLLKLAMGPSFQFGKPAKEIKQGKQKKEPKAKRLKVEPVKE